MYVVGFLVAIGLMVPVLLVLMGQPFIKREGDVVAKFTQEQSLYGIGWFLYSWVVRQFGRGQYLWFQKRLNHCRVIEPQTKYKEALYLHIATELALMLLAISWLLLSLVGELYRDPVLFMYWAAGLGFIVIWPDYGLKKRGIQKRRYFENHLPALLQQFSLLLGTGMGLEQSFETLLQHYQDPVMCQMLHLVQRERLASKPLYEAILIWGQLAPSRTVNRFVVLISQSGKHGLKAMAHQMLSLSDEALREQQLAIRTRAEQVSTKMLMPMMLSMVVLMILLIFPVMIQFGDF